MRLKCDSFSFFFTLLLQAIVANGVIPPHVSLLPQLLSFDSLIIDMSKIRTIGIYSLKENMLKI